MLANAYAEGNQVKIKAWFVTPHTIGTCQAGSAAVTLADTAGLSVANPFVLAGAGPEGLHLVSTIASIVGQVVTLNAPAQTSVKWALCGKLTDPSQVTFKVEAPDGSLTTKVAPDASIVSPSTGIWVLTYDPATDGTYPYRVEGTGTAKGAADGEFVMRSSRIV